MLPAFSTWSRKSFRVKWSQVRKRNSYSFPEFPHLNHFYLNKGLLEESKQGAVRVATDHLIRILRFSTKKRPLNPPTLEGPSKKSKRDVFINLVANQLSRILVLKGRSDISDYDLHCVVFHVRCTAFIRKNYPSILCCVPGHI